MWKTHNMQAGCGLVGTLATTEAQTHRVVAVIFQHAGCGLSKKYLRGSHLPEPWRTSLDVANKFLPLNRCRQSRPEPLRTVPIHEEKGTSHVSTHAHAHTRNIDNTTGQKSLTPWTCWPFHINTHAASNAPIATATRQFQWRYAIPYLRPRPSDERNARDCNVGARKKP